MPAQQKRRTQINASYLFLVVSFFVLGAKAWAYFITHSQAIFSDAVESIINVISAFISIWVVHISAKPADQDHPYGHGKVEYFSSAFEGGMIAFAAVLIFFEAGRALLHGSEIQQLGESFWLMIVATLANLALGYWLLRVSKKSRSIALRASGLHVLSDCWTTAGVVLSLGLIIIFKANWIDPVCALLIAVLLAKTGFDLVRESVSGLLDAEDRKILLTLKDIISNDHHPGIIQVHHARIMRAGSYHHIDAHAVVPEFWDVLEAHNRTQQFETRMISQYPYDGELHLHMDPCRRAYCGVCDLEGCPIRQSPFKEKLDITLEDLVSPEEPEVFRRAGNHPAN
jgi:cation diffusion facilitator family transporter